MRHFLTLSDIEKAEYPLLFARARFLKEAHRQRRLITTLRGRSLAMIFEKASTRTLVSFDCAMAQLGGHAMMLSASASQLSRGEPLADTARALSGYVDGIMMRTFAHDRLTELAKWSRVPVINGLTDTAHPAQLLADLFTIIEHFGSLDGRKVAFIGDGFSNMALSWIEAAALFGFQLTLAAPVGYAPSPFYLQKHTGNIRVVQDPATAIASADVVNTDVWTSMGQEAKTKQRLAEFSGFEVNAALMQLAQPQAIVLHCLPAHRGEEISDEVIESRQSLVWQQAENRMHAQKALLELFLLPNPTVTEQKS